MASQAPRKSPDAFRTISEVAGELDLPQHVLRFWETRFSQIKPMKRGGGRRYYRPEDVDLLRGIRLLLYGEGFTIRGVQRLLKEKGVGFVVEAGRNGSVETVAVGDPESAAPPTAPAEAEPLQSGDDEVTESLPAAPPPQMVYALEPEKRRRLEGVLSELLEAKRLLDEPRQA